jgi:hypothetical protein
MRHIINLKRWFWNSDQTELIHEAVIDGCNNKSKECAFYSSSEVFRSVELGIELSKVELQRKTLADGKIEINSESSKQIFKKL